MTGILDFNKPIKPNFYERKVIYGYVFVTDVNECTE